MWTNHHRMTGTVAALAILVAVGQQLRAELPVELELSTDLVSRYVWRGQLLTDDPVIQPSATISWCGLSANVWASIDATDIHDPEDAYRVQEVDYTLSYAFTPVDGLDLDGGVIYYDFPGTGLEATTEVYLAATASALPLTPTLSVYYDVDEAEGIYATLAVGHTFELTETLGLSLGAGLGFGDSEYNLFYFGLDESAVADLGLSASLDYAVNENFSISGYVGFTEIIDGDLEDNADLAYGDSDVFLGGVNFTFAF